MTRKKLCHSRTTRNTARRCGAHGTTPRGLAVGILLAWIAWQCIGPVLAGKLRLVLESHPNDNRYAPMQALHISISPALPRYKGLSYAVELDNTDLTAVADWSDTRVTRGPVA